MNTIKGLVDKYFKDFSYFYRHLRYRVFIAFALSFTVGVLDGFGLAMFFPLLEMTSGEMKASGEGLGGLSFLIRIFELTGVSLTIYSVLIVIAIFFTLKGVAKFAEQYYNVIVQQYFIKRLRYESVKKLGNIQYKTFAVSDAGRIQNTLSGEMNRVAQAYRFYFAALQAVVLLVVYVFFAILADPKFAILVVIGGGLSNLVYSRLYKNTKLASAKITTGGHEFQGLLIQLVSFFKYFRATGLIDDYSRRLKSSIDYIQDRTKKIGFYNAVLIASREPLVIIVVVVVIVIQIAFFSESITAIILSLMFFYRSLNALMQMQTNWNGFLAMSGSLTNMTEFIEDITAKQEISGDVKLHEVQIGIELQNVCFSYERRQVLKNISLFVRKNQTVAFVGESGSGKTTLINLLTGLLPVEEGTFKVDNISSDILDLKFYQKRIGYITQEPVIFSDSVFNNITLWAEDTPSNIARFWEALKKAAIDDFVKGLSEQENTKLGNNGILVSGGQRQRLSIARELYKDIDILIMDEATSAMDSETETIIQETIEGLHGSMTIIIVAHRLSTIKQADIIYLLENGSISDFGDFHCLSQKSTKFQRMIAFQQLNS